MSLLTRWFVPARSRVPAHLRDAVRAWQTLRQPDLKIGLPMTRFVVVDTETSSIDPHSARVLSIGACIVEGSSARLDRCFERTIRQDIPTDSANILVHGLGREQQAGGEPPADALAAFLAFAGKPVFVGFHALFDATVLRRPLQQALGLDLRSPWLDLAVLLPALMRAPERSGWQLDRWLESLALDLSSRHSAIGDAWSTAQLLLIALALAPQRGIGSAHALFDLQRAELARAVNAAAAPPLG